MTWIRVVVLALAGSLCTAQVATLPSVRLLQPFGLEHFSRQYRLAVDTFFTAQMAYEHADYRAASAVLDGLWKLYPPASPEWVRLMRESNAVAQSTGADFGTPPCYYALRMLTECVAWRMRTGAPSPTVPVRFSVILIGHSHGIQPANLQELQKIHYHV